MVMDHLNVRSLWILIFVLVVLDDDPARMNGATRRQCSGKAKAMISSLGDLRPREPGAVSAILRPWGQQLQRDAAGMAPGGAGAILRASGVRTAAEVELTVGGC